MKRILLRIDCTKDWCRFHAEVNAHDVETANAAVIDLETCPNCGETLEFNAKQVEAE